MRTAIRSADELCRLLDLDLKQQKGSAEAAQAFPVFVPRGLLSRIQKGDPTDPILRQILPIDDECRIVPGFDPDPLSESEATRAPGLLQKYDGRALLVVTGACAIHCRYCFRRSFPYSDSPHSLEQWKAVIRELSDDASIHEVLLSGGDPLTVVDEQLEQLIASIAEVQHIRRLRIHTRLPIAIPSRITQRLVRVLSNSRLTPVFVIHANHAAELDQSVNDALDRLISAGIPVLNQAVLLKGVNDTAAALIELFETLADLRVMPYYLHQLDRVSGAAHFEVPVRRGMELMRQVRAKLPGYAVPRYVQEIPGEANKVVLM